MPAAERGPLQQALEAAQAQAPGTKLSFIAFPGTAFSSPHHNTFFLRGNEPLTSSCSPVLVDARTAQVTAAPQLPWYLTALLVSQPLHFGDYGGMPMKILWALLDIATIVVLGSGLYLWLRKGAGGQPFRPRGGQVCWRFCRRRIARIGRSALHRGRCMNKHRRFWALWGWPIVMGVLSTTGLLTALVSDTWGDWWSWAALGVPVAVMGWYSWPRRSAATAHAVPSPPIHPARPAHLRAEFLVSLIASSMHYQPSPCAAHCCALRCLPPHRTGCGRDGAGLAHPRCTHSHRSPTAAGEGKALSTVTVNASADASAQGLSPAYPGGQVARARAGILGTRDAMDTPFSAISYTNELILDRHARSVGDVLQNDPTVRVARGFGNFQESYFIRGFLLDSDDTAYNGCTACCHASTSPPNCFERVEVLRGASAFLNGASPQAAALAAASTCCPSARPTSP